VKNLYQSATAAEVKERIARLRPDAQRQWGKMNVGQAMAHCAIGMEMATGERLPARMFIGRLIGGMVKKAALGNEAPLKKNTPTAPFLLITDDRDLTVEQARLITNIDRFAAAGPAGCTTHPHTFFGKLTPDEWAVLMYKHVDHHLRQFGG